jgi:hypothetical protein
VNSSTAGWALIGSTNSHGLKLLLKFARHRRGTVWWSQIYRDGVRYNFSTGTNNRRKVEAVEDKFKRELHAKVFGLIDYDPEVTISTLIAHFMAKANPSASVNRQPSPLWPDSPLNDSAGLVGTKPRGPELTGTETTIRSRSSGSEANGLFLRRDSASLVQHNPRKPGWLFILTFVPWRGTGITTFVTLQPN